MKGEEGDETRLIEYSDGETFLQGTLNTITGSITGDVRQLGSSMDDSVFLTSQPVTHTFSLYVVGGDGGGGVGGGG